MRTDPNTLEYQELAPGVHGLTEEMLGMLVIHVIIADPPGQGNVSRYLDTLPTDRPIMAVRVLSEKLAGMLSRRGFSPGKVVAEGIGEVEVYFRGVDPRFLVGAPLHSRRERAR